MIENKDRKKRTAFISTLEKLKLKEAIDPNSILLVTPGPNGNTIITHPSLNFSYTSPIHICEPDRIAVDNEGSVCLSDNDIDRIAQRVIDILKKERLL